MSPERLTSGGTTEARSDIYALTCVLYECLTGHPPFQGESVEQHIAAHLMTPPPRPSASDCKLPVSFDAVIEKGLAKDPSNRYQTALELADAARAALPRKTALKMTRPELSETKASSAKAKSERLAPVSTSASTVFAPTMLANAAARTGISGSDERTVSADVAYDPGPLGGFAFWATISIVFLISAAVLVAVFIGLLAH
jgi:serine/threonine-protein kinase